MESEVSKQLNDIGNEEESFSYAMQLVMSSVLPMALQTTIELGVFDVIAKAGLGAKLSANDIADQLPTKNPDAPKMLDRLLGLLATHSILHCSSAQTHTDDDDASTVSQRLYSLAPASKFFARDADAMSLGPILTLIQHKVFLESWVHLKDAILEGGNPFEMAHGVHVFNYLGLDSEFNKIFNISLTQHTSIVMKKILESYRGFENLNTLVDVGGGFGFNLSMITSKYPHIKAINFDLPHVIQQAPPYSGVEHVAGDMFESVPKGDAIFMKNCYDATPEKGKVIVVESGITAMPDTTASTKCNFEVDVFMMAHDLGGKERNQHEFLQLAKAAGFKGIKYQCRARNFWSPRDFAWYASALEDIERMKPHGPGPELFDQDDDDDVPLTTVMKKKQRVASSKMKQIASSSKGKGKEKVTAESGEEQRKRKKLELLDSTIRIAPTIPTSQNPSTSTMVFMPTPTVTAPLRPQLLITQPMAPTAVRPPPLRPASMYNETIQVASYATRSRLSKFMPPQPPNAGHE
ncbi:caffeic acid 3-O-methyltransferase-like [Senna tora]|uniref:Caffeic acid 3-O-methyltransferase-like n=1 Tax=Senna tora TaxID=362788 RepID=A0A834XE54_9FABA|nr:caffeic acid 3-O-methyltransferase-like [Senna tora]